MSRELMSLPIVQPTSRPREFVTSASSGSGTFHFASRRMPTSPPVATRLTVSVRLELKSPAVTAPADGELWDALVAAVLEHDPDGRPLPFMLPFATDAKHLMALGVPSYGFSPLRTYHI